MSFGKLKRRFQALINRKDVTDELAGDFVTEAVADLERELRIGPMEAMLTQDTWDGVKNAIIIPPGFLESINLFTNATELTQVDLAQFLTMKDQGGSPTSFVKIADRWLVKPTPAPGTQVFLHYYSQSQTLGSDADQNVWTTSGFNAVVYQAAALAADFYQMEDQHAQRFQSRADRYIAAMADQDHNEKWSGRIAIPYPTDVGPH